MELMFTDRKGNLCEKPEGKPVGLRESAYGVYISASKVLLVKPMWVDRWELPGGGKEPHETILEALHREFSEETGIKIINVLKKPIKIIKSQFYADDVDKYFISINSFFRINGHHAKNEDMMISAEIKEVRWIPLSVLNTIKMNDVHRMVVSGIPQKIPSTLMPTLVM